MRPTLALSATLYCIGFNPVSAVMIGAGCLVFWRSVKGLAMLGIG